MSPTMLMLAALSTGQPGVVPPPGAFPIARPGAGVPVYRVQAAEPAPPPGSPDHLHPVPGQPTTPSLDPFPQLTERSAPSPEAAQDADKEDKWFFMRQLEGSSLGTLMAERRLSVSGWVQQSYTWSTTDVTNQPVVWNDRADKYLLNQVWLRLDKAVDPEAGEATWGYRADLLYGTDYRFSLMRGLIPGQLVNSNPLQQNLYGFDPIQFYANVFLPNLFQGTDIRAGRLFTPWGYESLEGVSAPFVSRSYAFNWSPPFTHMGIMISPKFNDKWSGKYMLANGNDVFFDHTQEMRFVGATTYQATEDTSATLGWTLGRGKMNTGAPFSPATVGLNSEPAGRNNFNALDLVVSHNLNEKVNLAAEFIWGNQWGVPANVPGGIIDLRKGVGQTGTANWFAWAQYLNYKINDKWTSVTRFELFDDSNGQRTGFDGLYTAITTGVQWAPVPDILIRPSVRYDTNNQSAPFEGKHYIWTGVMEAIVRY